MLGELLGARYKIVDVLGSGGFGHTYIAEDTQRPGNPRCVLKHLTFASSNTSVLEQVRRLFQAEAETLEKLGRHDQIPQLLAYFEEKREFYLVQEFIAGQSLSKELEDNHRLAEHEVLSLLEDVLQILEYVHNQGVIHRDIKPENLIRRLSDRKFVLIDFGAVKTIGNTIADVTGETSLSVPIYTSGYGASEQCLGRPRFNSDLYSLGMVAIQALTGMRPSQLPHDFNTSEVIWRDQADVSPVIADFLDRLVAYHFLHRYQSATEALQALRQIITAAPTRMTHPGAALSRIGATAVPPVNTHIQGTATIAEDAIAEVVDRTPATHKVRLSNIALLSASGVALVFASVVLARNFLPISFPVPSPSTPSDALIPSNNLDAALQKRVSAGERLLNTWKANPQKQAGVEHFSASNYQAAAKAFQAARMSDRSDPESLIYLNNARIGNKKSYDIAVVVAFGDDALRSILEILRGVAQVQDEVNRAGGIAGVPLKVILANDSNDPDSARQVATLLTKNPSVLGVVGHAISDTSMAAASIYQANQLVMISPVSTAVQLSNVGNYIFRTTPSDQLTARSLVNHMLNRLKKRRVVVFFNSTSNYSNSLKTEFRNALFYSANIEPLAEFDLARPDFDSYESLNQAIAQKADVMMLATDHTRSDRAMQLLLVNDQRLPVLSGDSLFTPKVLQNAGKYALGMVLAVPADPTRFPFTQKYTGLWGQTTRPSWRTILAYDATQTLVTALRHEATRTGIQRTLAQPTFTAPGATQVITFLPTGDRKGSIQLMTVSPTTNKKARSYMFKPLP